MQLGLCLAVGAVMVSGTGCGMFRGKPAEQDAGEEQKPSAQVVGEIASVHRGDGFVLIKRFGQAGFGPDLLYSSLNPGGTTASLRPTGEKLGRFYAADIQEGEPSAGDLVIARQLPREKAPRATPLPPAGPNQGVHP